MKSKHTISGIVFSSALGTISHFLYELSDYNNFIGVLTPINESIWEHLKLLFFPIILFSVYEYFATNKAESLIPARTISLLAGMFFIISSYYTVSGIIGKNIDWFNITIYFIAVILVFALTKLLMKNSSKTSNELLIICLAIIVIIAILFAIWTFYPPNLNIFIDRQTKLRGIYRI